MSTLDNINENILHKIDIIEKVIYICINDLKLPISNLDQKYLLNYYNNMYTNDYNNNYYNNIPISFSQNLKILTKRYLLFLEKKIFMKYNRLYF